MMRRVVVGLLLLCLESGALDFVRSNDNGIAYVSANADTTGVKVVTVTQY